MKILDIKPKIFKNFPEIKTFLAIGKFNFSLSNSKLVINERKKLLQTAEIMRNNLLVLSQVGGKELLYVTPKRKIDFLSPKIPEGDGFYTNCPSIFLAIRTADCLPILFYNKSSGVIGAIHAGWLGTSKKIAQKTIRELQKKFSTKLEDFYFYLGPAAQVCCYDITPKLERLKFFDKKITPQIIRKKSDKIYLDFVKANKLQLKELRIKEQQIEDSEICTIHNSELPSHRREGNKRQKTLLSIIGMIK